MNYIFYYFGQVPDYVEYSINSVLNVDPKSQIFICSDQKVNFKNVIHVDPKLVESKNTKLVKDLNYFKDGDQNPLWSSSMMRIFYINDVARHFKIDSFVHFDSDVLLFKPFEKLSYLFEKINYPILLHCKSGADRAGLASVMYHLMVLDTPFQIARKHLSIRFLHLKFSRSGILDFMLDTYEKESKMTSLNFRSWIETKYDPNKLTKIYRG